MPVTGTPIWVPLVLGSDRSEGVVFVKLGTGVGAGILSGGACITGSRCGRRNRAHQYPCGRAALCLRTIGLLVKYVGQEAVEEAARRAGLTEDADDLVDAFVARYDVGDVEVCKEVNTINQALATALTSVVNVVAPRVLVLAGSPLCFSEAFVRALEGRLEQQTLFSLGSA